MLIYIVEKITVLEKTAFQFGFRKMISVGYSLLVPLPKEWTRNMKMGKGDTVRIEMMPDRTLRISSVNEMEMRH